MKTRIAIFSLFLSISTQINSQTGIVVGLGVSTAYTDNPAVSVQGEFISGYHVSLSGRFGSNKWYARPGLELHQIKQHSKKMLDPFSELKSVSIIKVPAQIGYRIIKSTRLNLRVAGGFQFSYIASIEKNTFMLDHNSIQDIQFGSLIGAGIDLGPLAIDINFEKGLTEFYTDLGYKSDYVIVTVGFLF